jgi:transcriptional regulator with XRE-family HTH domain
MSALPEARIRHPGTTGAMAESGTPAFLAVPIDSSSCKRDFVEPSNIGKGSSKEMSFGRRLAEERKRLGLKQAEFAKRVGTVVPAQSLYENDRRGLRADYLARAAEAGVDVRYVLTGRRGEGGWLGTGPADLLTAHRALPAEVQQALEELARALREKLARRPSR